MSLFMAAGTDNTVACRNDSGNYFAGDCMAYKAGGWFWRRLCSDGHRNVYWICRKYGFIADGAFAVLSGITVPACLQESKPEADDSLCTVSDSRMPDLDDYTKKWRIILKRIKTEELHGSYTIEASLLMGIILPLLVAIIYMGFFLHDRGFLQGAAHEAAVLASLQADQKGVDMAGTAQCLTTNRTLGIRTVSAAYSADERRVEVTYEGNFQVPGMIRRFFGKNGIPVRSSVTLSLERPSKRIQKLRGIAKVMKGIGRTGE